MEFQQIQSFVEVAKLLNFSKAAEKLHITQSTMSARIQKLEIDLGVPLFIRLGKAIRLSKYGEAFLPYALQSIEIMDSGIKRIEEERNNIFSKLTISAANPLGTLILPYILPALHDAVPGIRIQVVRNTGYSEEILKMVMESQIDIGFFNNGELSSQIADFNPVVLFPLYGDDFIMLAKPSHELAKASAVSPSALSEYCFAYMGQKTSVSKHILNYFDLHHVKPESTIEINSIPGIKEMLKKTDMLTFLPRLTAIEDIKKGDLVEVLLETPPPRIVTFLAYQQNYCEPKIIEIIKEKVTAIIDELKLPLSIIHA